MTRLPKPNFRKLFHFEWPVWPLFLFRFLVAMSVSGIMLNMLEMSNIIWNDGTFHSFEMGIILASRMWGIALSGLVVGRLADKFSRKILLIGMGTLISIGKILNGFAQESNPESYGFFVFCSVLVGLGLGGVDPIILSYTNDALNPKIRSKYFSIQESSRQIGSICGTIVSAILFQTGLWRVYFWGTGIIIAGLGILIFFFLKEPKRGQNSQSDLSELLKTTDITYDYQLNKKTIRSTIFSPTNIIAFIEGIFTWLIFSTALYMIYPYVQSPPYNISAISSSILMIMFGLPGAIFGALFFGRLSDRLGNRDIRWRVLLIIFSIVGLFISIILIFMVPLVELTPEQGNDFGLLLSHPSAWILGGVMFSLRAVLGIYFINQNPIIQAINLPEAQGTVTSWGQFLETVANGLGPVIAGYLLSINQGNYFNAIRFIILLGLPGAILWIGSLKFIKTDANRIQTILKERTEELKNTHQNKPGLMN